MDTYSARVVKGAIKSTKRFVSRTCYILFGRGAIARFNELYIAYLSTEPVE